jgi:hypothetical protein
MTTLAGDDAVVAIHTNTCSSVCFTSIYNTLASAHQDCVHDIYMSVVVLRLLLCCNGNSVYVCYCIELVI